jgi:hypothetical protein
MGMIESMHPKLPAVTYSAELAKMSIGYPSIHLLNLLHKFGFPVAHIYAFVITKIDTKSVCKVLPEC